MPELAPDPRLGDDTLFTPAEAADLLRVSPRTLADWRLDGRGPRWGKHGRNYVFYRLGDLRAFIRSGLSAGC